MHNGYEPREYLDRLINRWWIITICMVLGAGIGWVFHFTQPPLFESRSVISTAINYSETGLMTDLEEDHVLSVIGEVIVSDSVITQLQESLNPETRAMVAENFRSHLFAEREGYRWILRVRAANTKTADEISLRWADIATDTLDEALSHSRKALLLSRQISQLESCFTKAVTTRPAAPPCVLSSIKAISIELNDLGAKYIAELALSYGLIPAVVFSETQTGNDIGAPVTFKTAELVLAGAVLGFIGGVILVLSGFPGPNSKALPFAK
jgi:hypothetical protein